MTIDLEDRLVQYRHALDDAIAADVRDPNRPPAQRPRVALAAAAVVALLSVGGLVAISRSDGATSSADSTVPSASASPTDGVLPRLLLDPADGWEVTRVEDYVLRDSGGAFTRVDYVNRDQAVTVSLRRTREPVRLGSGGEQYGPCGMLAVDPLDGGEMVGYARDGGDSGAFYWSVDDHVVLRVTVDGMPFADAEALARELAGSDDDWLAVRVAVKPEQLIADPADERSTWQQWWHGDLGFIPNDQGPGPFDVDTDDVTTGHWEWSIVFCTDPA